MMDKPSDFSACNQKEAEKELWEYFSQPEFDFNVKTLKEDIHQAYCICADEEKNISQIETKMVILLLTHQYSKLIQKMALQFSASLPEKSIEDLLADAQLIFCEGIFKYRLSKKTKFITFIVTVLNSRLINQVQHYQTKTRQKFSIQQNIFLDAPAMIVDITPEEYQIKHNHQILYALKIKYLKSQSMQEYHYLMINPNLKIKKIYNKGTFLGIKRAKNAAEISLDDFINSDNKETSLSELIIAPTINQNSHDFQFQEVDNQITLQELTQKILKLLTPEEYQVIIYQYGLLGHQQKTQKELALQLNKNIAQIGALKKSAMIKIKDYCESRQWQKSADILQ